MDIIEEAKKALESANYLENAMYDEQDFEHLNNIRYFLTNFIKCNDDVQC